MQDRRYRYRTSVLVGPWRQTIVEAIEDAIRAHQAVRSGEHKEGVTWLVRGEIETQNKPG